MFLTIKTKAGQQKTKVAPKQVAMKKGSAMKKVNPRAAKVATTEAAPNKVITWAGTYVGPKGGLWHLVKLNKKKEHGVWWVEEVWHKVGMADTTEKA